MSSRDTNKDAQGLDKKTLFVRQIPFDATSEDLSNFFSSFAPIRHAVVVTDSENQSRGFGFVSFALDEDAESALHDARKTKFNGDRLLRVDIAKRRDRTNNRGGASIGRERAEEPDIQNDTEESFFKREVEEKKRSRLIIRNLPWSIRDCDQLKKNFQRYGTVTECIIPRKKDGKMSGFAFVQMKKYSAAVAAVQNSKNLKLDGRQVAVDFAVEKSKWEQFRNKDKPMDDKEASDEEESEDEERNEDEEQNKKEEQKDDNEEDENDSTNIIEKPKPNKQEPFTIFIRNLPYDATKEGLSEHFLQFGPLKYALPVVDRESGLAKGTGFVAFKNELDFKQCIENAPDPRAASTSGASTSMLLLPDDVPAAYVYDGRILSVTSAVNRDRANYLRDKNAEARNVALGRDDMVSGKKDRRNLFLLNEGRVSANSKMADVFTAGEIEMREKSYKMRIEQLNKNPSLHLSLTRLAIRNLPRALTEKAFKALGRKAVVQFASEVKQELRQPLTKEEVSRSVKNKPEEESKKSKKKGVVRQAKILVEVTAGGNAGRSKGYGFLEFRDHKSALMSLRWLNGHEITREELVEGLTEEEQRYLKLDSKRRLIAEFAVEHANVVNRRREKVKQAREFSDLKKEATKQEEEKKIEQGNQKRKLESEDKSKDFIKFKRRKKNKKNKTN